VLDKRWRVLYPDGQYTHLLSIREALPLFQLWGTELLEMKKVKERSNSSP
jgi:hypothetical protein